ncbi:helix-turn-helix domain-containing protein [Streptomyces canus]|uniref:helix-turn-helix domain-containing protein n=1 Tax=Streptomyces canus TaxID=58343 RepID=UPI002E29E467|nr:helix-turn-helix domain-containing protein [Streptomyces canus]
MYFQLVEDSVSAHAPVRDDPRATLPGGLPDRYLTPDDVAAMFEVPLETVYQWRKKRTGPPGFRIGKHLRYDHADQGAA